MPTRTQTDELAAALRLAVARLQRRLRRHAVGGLTPSQYSVLATVDRLGPLRPSALAELEGMGAPTLSRVLGKLEARELLERATDPADARASLIKSSATGRRTLAATRSERTALLARSLADMEPQERATLSAALPALDTLIERMDREGLA